MPLPFALPVGLLLGMTLAWVARAELARSEVPLVLARPFLVALGLGVTVFAPVVGYFAALHGDWAYLYLVPWSRVPSAVDLVLVLVAALQVPLGFAIGTPWAIAKRGTRVLQLSAQPRHHAAQVRELCHGAHHLRREGRGRRGRGALLAQLCRGQQRVGVGLQGRGVLLVRSGAAIARRWEGRSC
jgi:hypothetical protein